MIRRPQKNRRSRRSLDPSSPALGTPVTATASVVATKFRLVFDQPVAVSGLPLSFTVEGAAPTGYDVVNAVTLDLDYLVNVAAGQDYVLGNNDPAVRSSTGGYVAAAAGTF